MEENKNWDIEEATRCLDLYKDLAPVGCGRTIRNMLRDYDKLKEAAKANAGSYTGPEDALKAIRCFYATARSIKGQSDAIIDTIALNKACGYQVSTEQFFEMVDAFEKKVPPKHFRKYIKRGEYYNRKSFIRCCKIENPKAYGIGIRVLREENKEKKHKMKQRILELKDEPSITIGKIIEILESEGYSVSKKTIQRYFVNVGIKWKDYKKIEKEREAEPDEGITLE